MRKTTQISTTISSGISSEMQAELASMANLDNQRIWKIAQSMMTEEEQEEMTKLSRLQAERPLTANEECILEQLRHEYGRVTLRKSRAYALLHLRDENI